MAAFDLDQILHDIATKHAYFHENLTNCNDKCFVDIHDKTGNNGITQLTTMKRVNPLYDFVNLCNQQVKDKSCNISFDTLVSFNKHSLKIKEEIKKTETYLQTLQSANDWINSLKPQYTKYSTTETAVSEPVAEAVSSTSRRRSKQKRYRSVTRKRY